MYPDARTFRIEGQGRNVDFNLEVAKEFCAEHSLEFDEEFYNGFVKERLKNVEISQRQFNCVMLCHIKAIHNIFNPKRYTFVQKLLICFHFLRGKPLSIRMKSEL